MHRCAHMLFNWLIGLSITGGLLIAPVPAQTCTPPGLPYQIKVEGTILDQSNRPVTDVSLLPGIVNGTVTIAPPNQNGAWSVVINGCSLSPPRCGFYLPGSEWYFFKAGWIFSPASFQVCQSTTVNVTARRAPFTAVSAANYLPTIAPGTISALFANTAGATLATGTQVANQIPLPETLANTSLMLTSAYLTEPVAAQLFFVSPTQVNFYMPPNFPLTAKVITLTLKNGAGTSYVGSAYLDRIAPAYFSANANGQGPASGVVARIRNGVLTYEDLVRFDRTLNRYVNIPVDLGLASDQVYLALFGTGFRARTGLDQVSATVGGINAQVTYAGEQPSFIGVDQTNILLPRNLAGRGEVNVALTVEGRAANIVNVAIK